MRGVAASYENKPTGGEAGEAVWGRRREGRGDEATGEGRNDMQEGEGSKHQLEMYVMEEAPFPAVACEVACYM